MKALVTLALLALIGTTAAQACSEHRRKPVTCTSTTSIVGTTTTKCR
jgi:ABC-type uncharacterized transport system substrate-binding protein